MAIMTNSDGDDGGGDGDFYCADDNSSRNNNFESQHRWLCMSWAFSAALIAAL